MLVSPITNSHKGRQLGSAKLKKETIEARALREREDHIGPERPPGEGKPGRVNIKLTERGRGSGKWSLDTGKGLQDQK